MTLIIHVKRGKWKGVFLGDWNVEDKSEDHPAKGFWVHAYPLASKKAAEVLVAIQTVLGHVNSEFPGNVTRMVRLGVVSRLHGTPPWRSMEARSENGQEPTDSQ